jgi:hypothetical protein
LGSLAATAWTQAGTESFLGLEVKKPRADKIVSWLFSLEGLNPDV